jgi:TM2 domain-containing membrane protein YozV
MVASEGEKANLMNAVGVFSAPLVSQSVVLSPFGVIEDSFRIWASFLNPLLAVLVAIGALSLLRERSSSYRTIILSWMLVSGVGTFFAVTLQTEVWRIWYVQPLWLLGGAGVGSLLGTRNASNPARFEAKTAAIIFIAGVAVYFLEPLLGVGVFYVAAVSPVLSNIGRPRQNIQTVFATTLIIFVCVFFLNHALRSLYPLFLDPHNYLEH